VTKDQLQQRVNKLLEAIEQHMLDTLSILDNNEPMEHDQELWCHLDDAYYHSTIGMGACPDKRQVEIEYSSSGYTPEQIADGKIRLAFRLKDKSKIRRVS
jgi:hypothetical protein